MNVGIDARMFGPSVGGGGLGRYVEQLVYGLQALDAENRYLLFLKKENEKLCQIRNDHFKTRLANIHWYSLQEQFSLPKIIDSANLDLVHFPHWNVPIALKTPFIVTIHDLILLDEPASSKTTTRSPLIHLTKRIGYKVVLKRAIERSRHIIAVSEFTKESIIRHFPKISSDKITVVYEGITKLPPPASNFQLPTSPFFLYVGNAYPHKNLEALLHAFSFFHKLHPEVKLVLAGRHDIFYKRLQKELDEIDIPRETVAFVMNPSDAELSSLYSKATVYLFPSRIEGFGLPPLEAMQHGVPVISSNAGSLPEILGTAAEYFPPSDIEAMVEAMEKAINNTALRQKMIKNGHKQTRNYSWKRMAKEILDIYENYGG